MLDTTGELITRQSPLVDTVKEQQSLSTKEALKVQPLKELMNPFKAKTKLDLYELRQHNYNGQAKDNIADKPFLSRFFQPNAKDRQYYEFQWTGPSRLKGEIKERNCLVVEEKISDDLIAIAVFDTNERAKPYTYKTEVSKGITREISFIYLDNLYLVQPKTEQALDLAAPWYALTPDTKDQFVESTQRRIGLMAIDAQTTTTAVLEAFVRTNTILLSDTQDDASWQMTEAIGEEKTPVLKRWVAGIKAGADSTQKTRDLVRNEKGNVDNLAVAIARFTADELTSKISRKPVRFPQIFLPAVIQVQTGKPINPAINKALSPYLSDYDYVDYLKHQGLEGIVRLQRNSVAATLRLLDLLLGKGFKFPGLDSREALVREVKSVLRYDDKLYRQKLEEDESGLTFS